MNDSWRVMNITRVGWQDYLLSSDILFPSKCHLRRIEDCRSINVSLGLAAKNEKFELFDYLERPNQEHDGRERLRIVGRFLVAFIINATLPVVGIFYHGFSNLKLRISRYWQRATITPKDLQTLDQKINAHSEEFFRSLRGAEPFLIAVAALALRSSLTKMNFSLLTFKGLNNKVDLLLKCVGYFSAFSHVAGNAQAASHALNANSIAQFLYRESSTLCMRSFNLKQEFGVVGQNGAILHPNALIDKLETKEQLVDFLTHYYSEKQALFLQEIQFIAGDLPPGHSIPFVYPPKASNIVTFLRQGNYFAEEKIDQIEANLEHYERYGQKILDYINNSFSINLELPFLPEDDCKPFFSRSQETSREFDTYRTDLNDIFKALQTVEENLPEAYVNIRKNVHRILSQKKLSEEGTDLKIERFEDLIPIAKDLLELKEGFDLKAIDRSKVRKKFCFHPDKTINYLDPIKKEAAGLFHLFDLCAEIAKTTLPTVDPGVEATE